MPVNCQEQGVVMLEPYRTFGMKKLEHCWHCVISTAWGWEGVMYQISFKLVSKKDLGNYIPGSLTSICTRQISRNYSERLSQWPHG